MELNETNENKEEYSKTFRDKVLESKFGGHELNEETGYSKTFRDKVLESKFGRHELNRETEYSKTFRDKVLESKFNSSSEDIDFEKSSRTK